MPLTPPAPSARMPIGISVIIPVYNARRFVAQAVESALGQPQTREVLLVEDGSQDESLAACQALAAEHTRVRLLRHAGGANRGAGATRNLGIASAASEHVAFLDADDYYLPDRFSMAEEIFSRDPEADGVYEAVGTHFEDDAARERWHAHRKHELTTVRERVPPELLFETQAPIGSSGAPHLDGLVVTRSALNTLHPDNTTGTGPFDESLRLHQDTALFVQLAAVCDLLPGRLDRPVAMRRIHADNRILAPRPPSQVYRARLAMWISLWRWSRARRLPLARRRLLMRRLLGWAAGGPAPSRAALVRLLAAHPSIVLDSAFWSALQPE